MSTAAGTQRQGSGRGAGRSTLLGRAARLTRHPRVLGDVLGLRRNARVARAAGQALGPAEALTENGFTVFRGLFGADEVADLAARFTREAGITEGVRFTKTDAANRLPATRDVLFDDRVLSAVRSALGDVPISFLQVSDLHYLHDTAGWHRDSVHRAPDNTDCPDWREQDGRFGVVKAILYLESDNAAMGIMCGSHASPIEIDRVAVKLLEKRHAQLVLDTAEPNRRFTAAQKRLPLAWRARPGDLLVFDQRMYHAGRRVDGGRVTADREAAKFTLSLVFGADNTHSHRFYSYFRYARRELGYRAFTPELHAALAERDLLLGTGTANYYEQHPQELRLAALRKPEQLEALIAEFEAAGAGRRG